MNKCRTELFVPEVGKLKEGEAMIKISALKRADIKQ